MSADRDLTRPLRTEPAEPATQPPTDPNATQPPTDPGPPKTIPQIGPLVPQPAGPATDAPQGYAIEGELGRGGMGVVYRARQLGLNRPCALKMVLSAAHADAKELVRFLAEAEAVAAVRHPHVVAVYDFGQHAGRPYLAMEVLDGGSLSDRLKAGRLAPRDAARLLADLADAVQAAHDLGIVHRDLKPANVLFDAAGSPRVTDFGLAKRAASELTATGAIMGTPAYMAPEQAAGRGKFVGPAADVYALGVILFEAVTGRRPFEAADTGSLLLKVIGEDAPAARSAAPDVPRDLDLIAAKCLAKGPHERYPTAGALAADLRRYLAGEPVTVRPAGRVEKAAK